jgi:hypothetical protein
MFKARRRRLKGHMAFMGERRVTCRVFEGNPEVQNHLEDLGFEGKDNIKMDLKDDCREDWRALMIKVIHNRVK